ncbi:MAG: toxin-antitoxin system HicB family antitoxin [Synergistaceae bacterium]|nr:toxin-antitoxin system HicB family antitoxin [Synergistota bacterium]NLM71334.1 toxin-antitoxin system HicB family antitoxin [Synergistaceae bacterium]
MKNLDYYMSLPYVTEVTELSEEDGGGVVLCHPELGRLSTNAWGETYEEARGMLIEIKRGVFERCLADNLPIPEPKSEDLQKYSGRILLRMPRSLHKAVAEAAEEEGQSINAYIVGALLKTTERGEVAKEILAAIGSQIENTMRFAMFNFGEIGYYARDHALEKQAARRGAEHPSWAATQESSQVS